MLETGKITLHQKGMEVIYTSASKTEEKNGIFVTTVKNNLEDKTEYRVTKTWKDRIFPQSQFPFGCIGLSTKIRNKTCDKRK